MKVAFFGTSDRSIPILNSLHNKFELVLCITKSDSRVGRKQKIKETGVKKWAKENNVEFTDIHSLKGNDLKHIIQKLEIARAEYGVVADFSLIIPKEIIDFFDGKFINTHFSLLPKYRGASPVQFAILNGDENTGITFHLVHEKLDRGSILHQIGYKMSHKETAGALYETLFEIAAEKLPQVLNDFASGKIEPQEQDESEASYTFSPSHPKNTFIYKEDAQINWKDKPGIIDRQIRAYHPWPVAWTYLKDFEKAGCLSSGKPKLKKHIDRDLKLKIYSVHFEEGKLQIDELQVEGKRVMSWKDFENGYLE
jgi:methionyl-tRNA formyltransferase